MVLFEEVQPILALAQRSIPSLWKVTRTMAEQHRYIAFAGFTRIARGTLAEVARDIRVFLDTGEAESAAPIAVFDAATSTPVDLDLRGAPEEVAGRAALFEAERRGDSEPTGARRKSPGPGRPRLGVVGREVTLLPRHWDWLNAQPGGASVTLRKLVDAARKEEPGHRQIRRAQDVTHRFIYAMAGDLPGFEEVARALYAWDLPRFEGLMGSWPPDVREHALELVLQGVEE